MNINKTQMRKKKKKIILIRDFQELFKTNI